MSILLSSWARVRCPSYQRVILDVNQQANGFGWNGGMFELKKWRGRRKLFAVGQHMPRRHGTMYASYESASINSEGQS